MGGHDNLSTNNYLPIGYTVITYKVDGSGNNSMASTSLVRALSLWCRWTFYFFLAIEWHIQYWESFARVEYGWSTVWILNEFDTSKAYRRDQQYFVICICRLHLSDFVWNLEISRELQPALWSEKRSKALKHGGYSVFAGVGLLAFNATCVFAFGDSERLSKMTGTHKKHRHDWPYLGSGTKSSMVEATRLRGKHIKRGQFSESNPVAMACWHAFGTTFKQAKSPRLQFQVEKKTETSKIKQFCIKVVTKRYRS